MNLAHVKVVGAVDKWEGHETRSGAEWARPALDLFF